MPADTRHLDEEIAGLDQLEIPRRERKPWTVRVWDAAWPKLAAIALFLAAWQLIVWSGWKPDYVLPPPIEVFQTLAEDIRTASFWQAVGITMQRAAIGFAAATLVGTLVGLAVGQSSVLRRAVGSLITGLQSMPSIVWFPFAILLFQLSETAIFFVVVLGAAPAIANGIIAGVDNIPPILLRAGRVLGARGLAAYRYVVLPASLPSFIGGLKQGWAFAWRSLMAGELLVVIRGKESIGFLLTQNRAVNNSSGLLATMLVILVIGIAVDSLLFGTLERAIRRRWGLLDPAR
jgi:NitT/TauT family transport system permease protein